MYGGFYSRGIGAVLLSVVPMLIYMLMYVVFIPLVPILCLLKSGTREEKTDWSMRIHSILALIATDIFWLYAIIPPVAQTSSVFCVLVLIIMIIVMNYGIFSQLNKGGEEE